MPAVRNRPLAALIILLAAVLLVLGLSACTGSHKQSSAGVAEPAGSVAAGGASAAASAAAGAQDGAALSAPKAASGSGGAAAVTTPLQQKDFVRTATLAVRVPNVDSAAKTILARAAAESGQVQSDDRSTNGSTHVATLIVRLPPAGLDPLIASTVSLGAELSRVITGQDVTAAHADVNARVAALQTSVARLQDFLSHSGSITDLVTLENDLSQRESTLESTLAQQRALNDQIALSTLTIHLSEAGAKPVAAPAQHAVGFLGALRSGWHGFTATMNWLAALAGYLIPFLPLLLVLALLVVGVGALVRQRQRRRQLRAEAALRTPKPVAAADEGATRP